MSGFSFPSLKKSLPKEYIKLVDSVVEAVDTKVTFTIEANKWLGGGKQPSKSADEVEKTLSDADALIVAAIKKLGPKDPLAENLSEASKATQQLKIEHRETVGTLIGMFEGLDKSRAQAIDTVIKKINGLEAECKKQAKTKAEELTQLVEGFHKEVNGLVTMNGGAALEGAKQAESAAKMLGRVVKTGVDIKGFQAAQKTLTELEDMVEALKKVEKVLKA